MTNKKKHRNYAITLLKRIVGPNFISEDKVQSCVGDYLSNLRDREKGNFSEDNYYGLAIDAMKELGYRKDDNGDFHKIDIDKKAQIRHNYDYGEGLYQNLNKYKSVSDFRTKRRKKRRKDIENILNSRPDRYKAKK